MFNDMHAAFSAGGGVDELITADGITLSDEGTTLAAGIVASILRSVMAMRTAETR